MLGNAAGPAVRAAHFFVGANDDEGKQGNEQAAEHLRKDRVSGFLAEGEMETEIAFVECLEVTPFYGRAHVGGDLFEVGEIGLAFGDEASGEGFQRGADGEAVMNILDGDEGDAGAAAVATLDETFGFEDMEGGADAGLRDAEPGGPFPFDELVAGEECPVDDLFANLGGD